MSILDLYFAGTETTSTALRWALLFFLHHPEVQDRCYKEICDVIGPDRAPSMRDKQEMTYLEATTLEVLRKADIVPMSASHGLASDVTFRGYVIPRDAIIIPSLTSILQDPEVWGDPENFRPERFIGPDGKVTRPEEFIPFGIGDHDTYMRGCCDIYIRMRCGRARRITRRSSLTNLFKVKVTFRATQKSTVMLSLNVLA